MENLKIDLCGLTDKEKQNAVWWLNELGFSTGFKSIDFYSYLYGCVGSQAPYDKTIQFGNSSKTFSRNTGKEITIPELRDLVVLKRNDVGDATHESHCGELKFILLGDWWNLFTGGKWQQFSHKQSPRCNKLKPIGKKEMKEYLDKQRDGTYKLIKADGGCIDRDWIEIPKGAEKYIQLSGNNRSFYKNGFKESWCSGKWLETACNKENLKTWNGFPVLWQQDQEPKQAEFLVKTHSGYVLQLLDKNAGGADVVRIPDGAEIAILASGVVYFWKSHFFNGGVNKDWVDMKGGWDASWYLKNVPSAITIWKRETLNDQVASAEVARQESKEWDLGDYDFAESDALIESNVEQSSIVKTLAERQSTYGDFSKVAEMTQGLLFVMSQYGYDDMPDTHKESIHMIASKLARIVNGDNNHLDSWHDIGGYSKLIENLINSVND